MIETKWIAWDGTTNKAVSPERLPVENEWSAKVVNGVVKMKCAYQEPVEFTEPTIVVSVIRIITVRALKQRLSIAERHAVRNTSNIYVEDIYDDLVGSAYVDLDDDKVAQGLGVVLNNLTTIDNIQDPRIKTVLNEVTRLAELLIDGQVYEQYNGTL